jgi:hypothetical protein
MQTVAELAGDLPDIPGDADAVMRALETVANEDGGEMDDQDMDEEDEEEMEMDGKDAEKSANLSKGHGQTGGADGIVDNDGGARGNPLMNRTDKITGGDN